MPVVPEDLGVLPGDGGIRNDDIIARLASNTGHGPGNCIAGTSHGAGQKLDKAENRGIVDYTHSG